MIEAPDAAETAGLLTGAPPPAPPRVLASSLCFLFLLSGAAGLAYEVIWFKRLAHVWGSSAVALSAVLASYLLGLGLGAWTFGRLADRARRPLLGYGLCELGVGALALLVPFELRALEVAAAALYPLVEGRPLLGAVVRCGLSLLVLGPPCFLMGGTFPLLVRRLTPERGTLRHATGSLYAANTLGGAAGAYATGFHLLPVLGVAATNGLAAAANAIAGTAAIAVSMAVRPLSAGSPPSARLESAGRLPRRGALLLAALLSGCASVALQVAWTRQLGLILGGSTYAFTAMLVVVLAGIGLGSLVFRGLRGIRDLAWLQGIVALALIVSTLAGQRTIEALTVLVGAARPLRADPTWNAALCGLAASALVLVPAACMGILLPLWAAAASRGAHDAGRTVGAVYGANTIGTLIGAVGGGLVLLPACGSSATVAAALGIYLVAALGLFPAAGPRGRVAFAALAVSGAGLVLLSAHGPDPVASNLGMYLYGPATPRAVQSVRPLYLAEGASATVLVTRHEAGALSLRVNGKVDASDAKDMATQLALAYVPRILRPDAREILVIGLGSGTTSGASLLFPETRVTCAEIEPAVVGAARQFEHVNHRPLDSERFRLVLEDGRTHLQGRGASYDVIASEPSNPWMAGVSSLFTREFYLAARRRLTEGGVLAQWLQSYALLPRDYAMVVRTVRSVFPHGGLLLLPGTDTLLLASERPLEPDGRALDAAQALFDSIPPARSDLERHLGAGDLRSLLLGRWILGDEGISRLLRDDGTSAVHTDLNLRLEFDAPLRLFDEGVLPTAVRARVLAAHDAAAVARRWDRWGCGPPQVAALRSLLDHFAAEGAWEPARELLDVCLRLSPEEPHFLAARFMSSPPADPAEWEAGFSEVLGSSAEEAARVAVWLQLGGDHARAVRSWRRLVDVHPRSATLWARLASGLAAAGDEDEAARALETARELDPFGAVVRSGTEQAARDGAR